jgi:hypothetical protein
MTSWTSQAFKGWIRSFSREKTFEELILPSAIADLDRLVPECQDFEQLAALCCTTGERARHLLESPICQVVMNEPHATTANYKTEMVQVAASAIAALTDFLVASEGIKACAAETIVFNLIIEERARQDEKFGETKNLNPLVWIAVIQEELSEAASEIECQRL